MAKAFLCYLPETYKGPKGDHMDVCIVVAADLAAAKVAADALEAGSLESGWTDRATFVDLDTTFTTGEIRATLVKTPVAFT